MTGTSRVYEPEAFQDRVAFAAAVISKGGNTTRRFDTCFEMNDGAEVVAVLVRRARAKPAGKLAANLFRYINEASAIESYNATAHLSHQQLSEKAAVSRAREAREVEAIKVEHRAKEEAS
jgi:precorrin-6B methylase 2